LTAASCSGLEEFMTASINRKRNEIAAFDEGP